MALARNIRPNRIIRDPRPKRGVAKVVTAFGSSFFRPQTQWSSPLSMSGRAGLRLPPCRARELRSVATRSQSTSGTGGSARPTACGRYLQKLGYFAFDAGSTAQDARPRGHRPGAAAEPAASGDEAAEAGLPRPAAPRR